MQASTRMQAVITCLAQKHSLDLATVGACLQLELPGSHPLVIAVVEPALVQVAHCQIPAEVPPGLVLGALFYRGFGPWVPLEVTLLNRTHTEVAWLTPDDQDRHDPTAAQASLAVFADRWADVLVAQGWPTRAAPYDDGWPAPTSARPSLALLEAWLAVAPGCEASDGCWVEPDGICPHGHPSWLRRLGLI